MKKFGKEMGKGIIIGTIMTAAVLTSIPAMAMSARKSIDVVYNNIKLVVDGREVTPSDGNGNVVEPFTYNGTTYLPLGACVDAITGGNKAVNWDSSTSTIYIGDYNADEMSKTVKMNTLKPILGEPFQEYTFINRQTTIKSDNASNCNGTFYLGGKYKTYNSMLLAKDSINTKDENIVVFRDAYTNRELAS